MKGSQYRPIAFWLAGLLICFAIILRTEFTTDLSAFLPRAPSAAEEVLVQQLRDGPVSRVVLLGVEGAPEPVLITLSKTLAKRLRGEADFDSVNNGEDVRLVQDQAFLWNNRYLLSSAVTAKQFSEAGLRQSLQSDLELLSSPAGVLLKKSIPGDPTGEMLHLADNIQLGAQPASRGGVWFSPDGMRALLVAQTVAAASNVDAQAKALAKIQNAFSALRKETDDAANARLAMTGPVVFSVATRDRIKGDAARFSAIATVMVASVLLLFYRSPRLLFFGLLPVISGALTGIAAVSLIFGSVHGITLGFGVTLIGEAVDYPIYLFTQTTPGTRPQDTIPRIWPTLRLGVMTSICGFGALLFSSFTGLAQLGAFTIAGLITAVSVTRWIVPLLLPSAFESRRPVTIGIVLRRVIRFAPRLRVPLLIVVAAAALILGLQHNSLWDNELASLSPLPVADKAADQTLRSQLDAPDVRYLVVVNGASQEAVLEASERIATVLDSLAGAHVLAGYQSPAAYLPSNITQTARQEAIPPRDELARRLDLAVGTMPFRADLFAPFLTKAAAARVQPLITRRTLDGTSFSSLVNALLIQRGRAWQALLPLRGIADPGRVAGAIGRSGIGGVFFLDIKRDSDALYGAYREQAVLLSLCGAAIILLLLFVSLGRARRVAAVAAPLAAAILVTGAGLILAGQKLSIFHLVGLLLVVAVGSNYSLFFEKKSAGGKDSEWVVASLALANLCTVIGFGVLSLSGVPVLHGIGVTVAAGTALSLFFSAICARTNV